MDDQSASASSTTDDPDAAASLEAAMQVPITVMLGPTGPLLQKLHRLMAPGQSLPPDVLSADDLRLLRDGLGDLCISLKDMSEDEHASFINQWWMKIVRELCYDMEDHLDEVYHGAQGLDDFSEFLAGAKDDFSGLLARVKDAKERRERFKWTPLKTIKPADLGEAGVSCLTSQMSPDPDLPIPMCINVDTGSVRSTVGDVEAPNKLVELLALDDDSNEKALKVIAINGCAGVGKTTVARALYRRYRGKFQCQALVTVSRNPDMRGFLASMLSQLKAPRPHGFPDVPDLIDAIGKHLQGKRYFIVVDDLWTVSVWNIISRAFPRGDYCSRIITTTQIEDVALACCGYYSAFIYTMEPLNDHESRKLFYGRVFGSEDGCPTGIKEVPYEIIKKCGGLPLAIVSIASLLASESNIIKEKWKHIQGSSASTSEGMRDVLNLIYTSLPPRLRTCLLYLSMYVQGYVIRKDDLVKQWVTEGFLITVEGRDTEEIAESYFDELVRRGMVQAVDTCYNGEVLSCTVHQMVLDFIRHKSMEENFVITVDYFQSTLALPDKVRRLSIQFGGVKSAYIPETIVTSQVRSLIFWGFFECVPSLTDYGLLRVLILHIWADEDNESFDLTEIGELFLLKYLKIECNITIRLPDKDKIRWLQHLETLQVDARLSAVPSDTVNMRRLLHFRLPSKYILPIVVVHMTSLRTLGYFDLNRYLVEDFDLKYLGRLTDLQELQLTCSTVQPAENMARNVQLLGLILEKLRVLLCLTLVPDASGSSCVTIPEDGFDMASPPPDLLLRRIELSRHCCIFFSLPKWFGVLNKLCILKIAVRELYWEDTDMLKGLPSLTDLSLYIQTAPAERIFIDEGGFQILTYFKFTCATPCLSFVEGAMPKVQKLKLGFNSDEWRSHTFEIIGFRHLTDLTEVSVKLGARGAHKFDSKAAKSAFEAALSDHLNSPIIILQCSDVIYYGDEDKGTATATEGKEEKLQGIRDGTKKNTGRSEEKQHEIEEGKKKKMKCSEEHVNNPLIDSRYMRMDHVSTPLKHRAQSVHVVMAAMDSLLPKMLHLLEEEGTLETGIKNLVNSLYKEMEALQDALREMGKMEADQRDEVLKAWARDVRDVSYDTEDIIDSLSVCSEGPEPDTNINDGLESIILRTSTLFSSWKAYRETAVAMDDITARRERYKAGVHIADNPNAAARFGSHLSALHKDPKELVGINVPRDEVIRRLTHGTGDALQQLKMLSIVGLGGLGKTTLAKSVYDKIQVQYDYSAFVVVSMEPDIRKVYMDILLEIDKHKYMNPGWSIYNENQLIDEVRRLLAKQRYLIIIDDICDVKSWERIKLALIDNGRGSRVVTTTPIHAVANRAGEVYELKPLSGVQSRALLNARLLYGEKKVDNNLLQASEQIMSKCGGVPLAIITMASLLVRKPMNDWSKVYSNIGFGSDVLGNTRKILLCAYYYLPYHLRPCLLHLHNFPMNGIIKKETLIWKWAAEGLIVEQPGTGLFELGEGYFQELIHRNMVMPAENDSHPGKVVGCRVHEEVFEMICSLSTEENFVTVLDGRKQRSPVGSKARRLAVQKWAAEDGDPLTNIRPERLRSFNTTRCHFSTELSLSRFELLRVIAIEECIFLKGRSYHLKYLGRLHLLRYLGLYNTPIDELPEEIGDLIYLQTLDLRGTRVFKLPGRVALLRQLKCLRVDGFLTEVPDWMGSLASLEELRLGNVYRSENFVKELGRLTELRELEIWIAGLDESHKEALVQSLKKLEKIQVLRLMGRPTLSSNNELSWGHYYPPRQLREFRLGTAILWLPAWINAYRPPMLSYLSVYVKAVDRNHLDILGALPELISLELLPPPWVDFPTIKGDGAFPKLRSFRTSSRFNCLWDAMPRLESLHFEIDAAFFDGDYLVASALENLLSLQKVEAKIKYTHTAELTKMEPLKRAVDKHSNSPSFHVVKTDELSWS